MYNCIICRYHEIATKGNNRNMFEKCLVENIRHVLREIAPECRVKRIRGRVWIEPGNESNSFEKDTLEVIVKRLADVFGLESFSPAVLLPVDMDVIRRTALEMVPPVLEKFAGKIH